MIWFSQCFQIILLIYRNLNLFRYTIWKKCGKNPLDQMSLLWMEMRCKWQVVGSVREHCKNCSSFHYRKRRFHGNYIARTSGQNRSRFRVVKYVGVVLSIGNTQLKVPNIWHLKERRYGLKPVLTKLSQFKFYPTPKMFHNLSYAAL